MVLRRGSNSARVAVLVLMMGVLQVCSFPGDSFSFFKNNCVSDARERNEAADWSKVAIIPSRIRQNEFEPMIIDLKQDRPYVIRITNADDRHHFFGAEHFFRSVALAKVDMLGNVEDQTCISRVDVAGRQTAEVVFVTVRDGRFEFADNFFTSPWFDFGNPMGVIYVQ